MITGRPLLAVVALSVGACAHYQHYQPAPVYSRNDAGAHASAYAQRSLADPALVPLFRAHDLAVPDSLWSATQLALAAVYFRPDLTVAQRRITLARAAEITAGVRPYPSVGGTVGRASHATEGRSSPWTFSLNAGFTVERGGKRGARIAQARAATLAAELRGESMLWQTIEAARQDAAIAAAADGDVTDALAELAAQRRAVGLLRARYAEGQLSRTDLARSEADLQSSVVGLTQATRARTDARATLARAVGVPVEQVNAIRVRPEARSACIVADSIGMPALEVLALRSRADIGVSLADYAVTEAQLRTQIGQQYPDISIGPGLAWDQGVARWILSLGLPSLPVDRARGPIGEAVARRALQAATVRTVQDSVLADVDSATAMCSQAAQEIAATDSLVDANAGALRSVRATYDRGEIGQTEVALADLALVRAQRTRHQAGQRLVGAGYAVERAVGALLSTPTLDWQHSYDLLH